MRHPRRRRRPPARRGSTLPRLRQTPRAHQARPLPHGHASRRRKVDGNKSRPLVLLAEKPRSNTYMVVGYEYSEEAGNVVRNKFGQKFESAVQSMKGMFWFDSFDSNMVEVAAKDVQKFLEQLHYMTEQV